MERTFIIGSEWLFYKIYCGPKTADRILTEVIKPLTSELIDKQQIDSWFFIRYADPKLHLRVRFHLTPPLLFNEVIKRFKEMIIPFIETNLVWKVMIDTYSREIERYGSDLIVDTEKYFYNESRLIINILEDIQDDENEIARWLFALRMIDETLENFEYKGEVKLRFLNSIRDDYGKEYGLDRNLKKQLSQKYRTNRGYIEQILNRENEYQEAENFFNYLKDWKRAVKPFTIQVLMKRTELSVPETDHLLKSYLHMMINRFFRSKQRLHELVLYDFLCQYYTSLVARESSLLIKGN
jgi:thiopeptide-type bacteriocin biosynthesis protein